MELVTMDTLNAQILSGLVAAGPNGGALNGAKCGLTKDDITPLSSLDLATVQAAECDFAGYAPKAVTWLAPSISDDGNQEIVGQVAEFRPTDETVDNTAHQAFLVNAAGDELLAIGTLDSAPVPMGHPTDSLLVILRIRNLSGGIVVDVS